MYPCIHVRTPTKALLSSTYTHMHVRKRGRSKDVVLSSSRPFSLVQQRPKIMVKNTGDLLQELQIDVKNRDLFLSTLCKYVTWRAFMPWSIHIVSLQYHAMEINTRWYWIPFSTSHGISRPHPPWVVGRFRHWDLISALLHSHHNNREDGHRDQAVAGYHRCSWSGEN